MLRTMKILIVLLLIISVISTGKYFSQSVMVDDERFAQTSQGDIFGDNTDKIAYLEQNWSKRDSLWFYNTTQGSNWMPYSIFLHLEQADSDALFRSDTQMNRYRYLTQAPSRTNPDGLPVGFVKNTYQEKDYLGFTCAACHTGQIDYNSIGIRIDGAPALADMDGMLRDVENALKATLNNEAKLARLAQKVVDSTDKDATAQFKQTLTKLYQEKQLYNQQNAPLHQNQRVDYGFARLDAFGRIFNRTLSHITPNDPSNYNPANAPVSYPFLWDTPHSDFVQWNGIGNNYGEGLAGLLGSLSRNTGEVLGVFASFKVGKHEDGSLHYESRLSCIV